MVNSLNRQITNNKIFLYMVIHDLKHPMESMISQLGVLQNQLEQHSQKLSSLFVNLDPLELDIERNIVESSVVHREEF